MVFREFFIQRMKNYSQNFTCFVKIKTSKTQTDAILLHITRRSYMFTEANSYMTSALIITAEFTDILQYICV